MMAVAVDDGDELERLRADVARLNRGIEMISVDLANAEASLRVERRKVTELRKRLEDQATGEDFAPEIQAAFAYWKVRCGHPRAKLGLERAAAVKARLKSGHSLLDVMRAIDGAAWDAFVNVETGKKYDELELICRNEVKFDRFEEVWRSIVSRGKVSRPLTAYCLPAGVSEPEFDFMDKCWRFKCPVCRFGWDVDHRPLAIGRDYLFCSGLCVGLTLEDVREALLAGFPVVPDA